MDIKDVDRMHLLGIADSIREIQGYIGQSDWKDFSQREDLRMAISTHMQQIGSAAALLSDDFKENYRDMDWDILRGLQYSNYDQELELDAHPQWHIVSQDLPVFLEQIEDLISELEREESIEDDLKYTGAQDGKNDYDKNKIQYLDPDDPEYQNRRSGDQFEDDLEDVDLDETVDEEDDGLLNRLKVVEGEVITQEPPMVPLGDVEVEDDSFIDRRFEDDDLMDGSSLDDYLEEEENK
ncbi:MAG TPA: hypothetical protein VD908_08595 [Cytophagales bacterium]|nr:hypothetical protein [Cytophagales bacterium]